MGNIWNSIISNLPNPHFLQTYEWGQVKAKYGWIPYYAVWYSDGSLSISPELPNDSVKTVVSASLLLKRSISGRGFISRFSVLYASKGPLLDWANKPLRERVLNDLQSFARQQGAIFLKIDPDVPLGRGIPGSPDANEEELGAVLQSELSRRGWTYSSDQIQFRNTVQIDLQSSEDEMLRRMKQKTRYNIRLADKKGVAVRVGEQGDLPMLARMYAETSVRDGFVIREAGYYQTVWGTFMQSALSAGQPAAVPLIAEVNDEPVGGLFLFMFGGRAYYVYGMSREIHREKMPTYLLQWEAMKYAKAAGCKVYDLWGAPEVFGESDSLWGVYRFKEGLGGWVLRTLGAWDYAPSKLLYRLYSGIIPKVLDVMRFRGKSQTRRNLDSQ